MLELLDRLCRHHHRLTTTKRWALVEGSGKRDFVTQEDPRHPRFGKGPKRPGAGVDLGEVASDHGAGEGAGGDNAGVDGNSAQRAAGASLVSPQVGGTSTRRSLPRQSQWP
jgi:hypothetical protein